MKGANFEVSEFAFSISSGEGDVDFRILKKKSIQGIKGYVDVYI